MLLKRGIERLIFLIRTSFLKKKLFLALKIDKNISLHVPYYSAKPGDCGIGCVAMLVAYAKHIKLNVADLATTYKTNANYDHKIGWSHASLVAVCKDFDVQMYAAENQYPSNLIASLKQNSPVVVSLRIPEPENISQENIYQPFDKWRDKTGHLCLLVGVTREGFILHDPRNIGKYSKNLKVPFKTFLEIFTGRCIYLTLPI